MPTSVTKREAMSGPDKRTRSFGPNILRARPDLPELSRRLECIPVAPPGRTQSAADMERMLVDLVPQDMRQRLAVLVIDV